jgi:alkylated DNA repair protein (DNA oxidative demethylase)
MMGQTSQDKVLSGFRFLPAYLDRDRQLSLLADLGGVIGQAPFFRPTMPRSGRPFSVEMTNAGPLGWLSDRAGYRYSDVHPVTGRPWPALPASILGLWEEVADYGAPPECCLINRYGPQGARMGLHQDRDEETFEAPVVSLSLGDRALFRIGGRERRGPTRSLALSSGDVVILGGEARLCFHGIDRTIPGSSRLIPGGGRLNVTLRRVTRPAD